MRVTPCLNQDCRCLNIHPDDAPTPLVCERCGGTDLLTPLPLRPLEALRERVARRVFVDGDGEVI